MPIEFRKVAIIGGGPAGISAARFLATSSGFKLILGFEERAASCSGVWALPSDHRNNNSRVLPADVRDHDPHYQDASSSSSSSAMYEDLEANIPKELMAFRGYPFPPSANLFPRRREVEDYLESYGQEWKRYFQFQTKVVNVSRNDDADLSGRWTIETTHTVSDVRQVFSVDAVVVCSGHYQVYHVPSIAGIHQLTSTIVTHSKFFRSASDFADLSVLLVGAGPSATDLFARLYPVVRKPLHISTTSNSSLPKNMMACNILPRITKFEQSETFGDTIEFSDGRQLHGIDLVLFCTGFKYAYPFFVKIGPTLTDDGKSVLNLYHHIFHENDFSLAFLGLGKRIVPFSQCQIEACVLARVWAGELEMPSNSTIKDWFSKEARRTAGRGSMQDFGFPDDFQRYEELRTWALQSRLSSNDVPSAMTTRDRWLRTIAPKLKSVCTATNVTREIVGTPEDLGFYQVSNS